MPTPSEHKTVQARILAYAQEIGWTFVPREEAEQRRGLKEGGFSNPPHARKWRTGMFARYYWRVGKPALL